MSVNQLKQLLVENGLTTSGKKMQMVARLTEALGTDEAELPEDNNSLQTQIDELRRTLAEAMDVIRNSISRVQGSTATGTTNELPQAGQNVDVVNSTMYETIMTGISQERTQNYHCTANDITEQIPDFDPINEQSLTVEQFVDSIEESRNTFGWEDRPLLVAVGRRLKGVARLWIDSTRHRYKTWCELKQALKTQYGTSLDEAEISNKMRAAVRKDSEKISEYCHRMEALGIRYKLSEAAIVRHTREGLKHYNLQHAIAAMQIHTPSDLRKVCETYFDNSYVDRSGKARDRYTGTKTNWKPERKNEKTDANTKMPPVTCYNCNEIGHFSSQCPKPSRRKRCQDCQKVHARGEPENCGKNVTVRKTSVKRQVSFEKQVLLNDKLFSTYVDTGSECHMISKSSVKKLNSIPSAFRVNLTGLWGGRCVATQQISANVKLDNASCDITLYIVENDNLTTDILLGSEIFSELNAEFTNGNLLFKRTEPALIMTNKTQKSCFSRAEINVGTNDDDKVAELPEVLNNHRNVFAESLGELGKTDLVEMEINVTTDRPIAQRPYRIPEPKKYAVKEMIDELLANNIIARSTSSYASPIIMIKKKNGTDRMCVDYRHLNRHTVKEEFPMQNIVENLMKAKRAKYFISLDMNSGFYQIPIAKNSQKFTAFVTPDGIFEFQRMPFGLRNAPAVFQRLMSLLMEKFPPDTIFYMDDILVTGNTIEEVLIKLDKILKVLDEANLTLNLKKCTFITEQINFLGHKITPTGIEPGEIKVAAIKQFPLPRNLTEVRRFLGLSGYFRKFVPAYARVAEPLNQLLRKNIPFIWAEKQTQAFEQLKRILTHKPVLAGYDINARHEIHSDASAAGIAAVLLQEAADETMHPVAYYSRSTTESEKMYHSSELEALAVVEALERFRYYVSGKRIKVVTDCSAITTLTQRKEVVPRIARWWLKIQDFDVEMVHRAGHRMPHVDALSRGPVEEAHEMDVAGLQTLKVQIEMDDWLFSMQLQDAKLKDIVNQIQCGKVTDNYEITNGRLFKRSGEKLLWVVPKYLRWKVVQDCHENSGHLSVDKTLYRLKEKFWFARMRNFVKSYVKSCVECAYNKGKGGRIEAEYHFNDLEPIPFKLVHIDHLGPFPKSRRRNEHVIVIIDAFTKFVSLKAVKDTSTKFVIEAIRELSSYVGMPEILVSDRGTAYTSKKFKQFCEVNDIKHQLIAVRTPRANGQVERTNRTLLSMLTTMTTEDRLWDEKIRDIQWALNSMSSSSTGRTPQQLLYNFTPRDTLQNQLVLALHNHDVITEEELQQQRKQASERINFKRKKAKERFDKTHQKPKPYVVGDLVLVEGDLPSIGHSRKLEPRYKGPYMVTKVLGKDRYVVEDLPKTRRTQKHYTSIFAADNMKRWCQLPEDDDAETCTSSDEDEDVQ